MSEATEPPPPDRTDATVTELADLPPVEYYQRRTMAAEDLGVRVFTLDDVVAGRRSANTSENSPFIFPEIESWDKPVDGDELLNNIREA